MEYVSDELKFAREIIKAQYTVMSFKIIKFPKMVTPYHLVQLFGTKIEMDEFKKIAKRHDVTILISGSLLIRTLLSKFIESMVMATMCDFSEEKYRIEMPKAILQDNLKHIKKSALESITEVKSDSNS